MRKQTLLGAVAIALFSGGVALAGTGESAHKKPEGRKMLSQEGCLNCHFSRGEGGLIGPPFDGIGKYRTSDQIYKMLTQPRSKEPITGKYPDMRKLMQHVRVAPARARIIADYLVTLPDSELTSGGHESVLANEMPPGFKFTPAEPSQSSHAGAAAFKKNGCFACHSINGIGGRAAPELDGVGGFRSRAFIENRIMKGAIVTYEGKSYRASEFSMPPSKLTKTEISKITDFLLTLPEN